MNEQDVWMFHEREDDSISNGGRRIVNDAVLYWRHGEKQRTERNSDWAANSLKPDERSE